MRTLLLLAGFIISSSAIATSADFAAGLSAYQKGDYAKAISEWRPLAEQGVAAAQFNLGLMALDGSGLMADG